MTIFTTYSVKIRNPQIVFCNTISIYRKAVDYLIGICDENWELMESLREIERLSYIEEIVHKTKSHPNPRYDFDCRFYKMPTYLRRSAINESIGKVSTYKANMKIWKKDHRGRKPRLPIAGFIFPTMYDYNMYKETGEYSAKIKVYIRNTWDWVDIELRKSDIDYIKRHCSQRIKCVPTLRKRGKEWFLDFPFKEKAELKEINIEDQTVVAVDLGINNAATISVMQADGTILGRHFCHLNAEIDRLMHKLNRIKKARQNHSHKNPRLWAKVGGINHDIAVKTALFIMDVAHLYNADTIVFEKLGRQGKLVGSTKQKVNVWRTREVKSIVTDKAHRLGMHVSDVCAIGTSSLAYDGSGKVERGIDRNHSICKFKNGKIYNSDLSATYNIGARYFAREILKSLPEMERLRIVAQVPQCRKGSTCTFSTFNNLNAVLVSSDFKRLSLGRRAEM